MSVNKTPSRRTESIGYELTKRERQYQQNPIVRDMPFKTRLVGGIERRFIPLDGGIYARGSTPLFSIKRHARFQAFPEHCHDGVEFNYVYAGSCSQVVNGRRVELTQGQTLMLSSDTVHTVLPLGQNDILFNLNINPEYLIGGVLNRLHCDSMVAQILVDSLESSFRHDDYLIFASEGNERLRTYMCNLLAEWNAPSAMARDIVESLFILVISELVVSLRAEGVQNTGTPMGTALPVLHYLEERYADCTLEQTAAHFHLNPTYLSGLLKEKIGLSYRELVQHLRLDAAERLLATTNLPVTEVARRVGYENATYFYRIFRRRCGCNPGEYRAQQTRR